VILAGAGGVIEMIYHLQLSTAMGDSVEFLGVTLNTTDPASWVGSLFVFATGFGLFELTRREFLKQWAEIQTDIEKEIKRRETA